MQGETNLGRQLIQVFGPHSAWQTIPPYQMMGRISNVFLLHIGKGTFWHDTGD